MASRAILHGSGVSSHARRSVRMQVHSMPSVRHRLLCCHYDLCEWGDMARSSDHRPVSLAATLVLDTTYADSCNPR